MPDGVSSESKLAEWIPYGPAFLSYEDTRYGQGALGVDYTINVDTRWRPDVVLGPQINTVDCGAAGGTAADSNGSALSGGMNATLFLYVIRGTKWAKITASTMALVSDGTETALSEAATSIVHTVTAAGTEEISVGMAGTAYRVIATVGNGTTDTHSANNESKVVAYFGSGIEDNANPRVVGLGGQSVYANTLSGSVTMDASAWSTIDILGPNDFTFTGFALDKDIWIIGSSAGPIYLDERFNHFRFLMPEIGEATTNCKQMAQVSWIGCLVPLRSGLMLINNGAVKVSVGPERFITNTSPIKGYVTGIAENMEWAYVAVYDPITDDTYLCAVNPGETHPDWHDQVLSWYPLAKFTDTNVNFLNDIDTANGVRTNPTVVGGYNDDIFYFIRGRTSREIDDTNYRFATSGTLYLTEMRRDPWIGKELEYIEFETVNCSSTDTVTVSISVDDATAQAVGAPVTTNGYHRIRIPREWKMRGRRIKPQVAFAANAATSSPRIRGNIRIWYREYELEVDDREKWR